MWSLPGHSRQVNKDHSPCCHRRPNGPGRLADKVVQPTTQFSEGCTYTRSIMNVSRARFTHSRQNGTLAESRSEEGSLTGSSAKPDTWRIPHSSPPFLPGTHTDRAITARGEAPRPAVFRPICCVSVQGRDGRGWGGGGLAGSRRIRFQLNQSYD